MLRLIRDAIYKTMTVSEKVEGWVKRLVRWAFWERIRVFGYQEVFDEREFLILKYTPSSEETKRRIAHEMVDKMLDEGVIEFSEEKNERYGNRILRAKLYVLP